MALRQEGLRQEQRENNIKSTIISPGAVQTELYQTISNRSGLCHRHARSYVNQ